MKVTGILDDPPVNTDFPLKVVVSYATLVKQVNMNNWINISDDNYCFVLLRPQYTAAQFDNLLPAFITKHMPPDHAGYNIRLQPLKEMHYDERFGNFNGRTFSRELITALSLIGLFLLIIACVNFHKSFHSAGYQPFKRGWSKESTGRQARAIAASIPGRNQPDMFYCANPGHDYSDNYAAFPEWIA